MPIKPRQKVSLQALNTLAVPATAEYFVEINSNEQLAEALIWANERRLPVLPLGGGSNLILQQDFPGLCIHMLNKGIEFLPVDDDWLDVRAQAGENWHDFVRTCLDHQAYGLENLALIPGTVGAAPIQNIGAYGVEVKDYLYQLEAMNCETGELIRFSNADCQFAYRESVFKSALLDQFIVTAVTFRLKTQAQPHYEYAGLAQALEQVSEPDAEDVFRAVVALRSAKLPDPRQVANVGSFFKNPVISPDHFAQLKAQYPNIVGYADKQGIKVAAGWLIDQAGWKGFQAEAVGVHDRQALVLVNPGHAKGREVLDLAHRIQADIREKFAILLDIEPRIY